MTRVERRRRKRRREIQRICAWTLLVAIELFAAAVPTAIIAAIIIPFAYFQRGYYGVGSEWLLIIAVFCITYGAIHNRICDRIFEEE